MTAANARSHNQTLDLDVHPPVIMRGCGRAEQAVTMEI